MQHKTLWLLLGLLLPLGLSAQRSIEWEALSQVKFDYVYSEPENRWKSEVTFSDSLKQLDGQQIQIKGHILPLELEGSMVVLSEYPFSSCFFCGGAGPESVIELRFKKAKRRWKQDALGTFMGTLRLNSTEFEMIYILEDAQFVN